MQTDAEVAAIAAGLDSDTKRTLRSAIPGVIAGVFIGDAAVAPLERAEAMGLCRPWFAPADHSTRGLAYAARLSPLGLRVAQHLKQENSRG